MRALEDVENALVALARERQRAQALQSAAASAEAALGRAQSLYDRGQIDLLPLLDAQRARLAVRVGANDSQHAAAARQRAALQGARRRLAGVRARRRARPQPTAAHPRRIPETHRTDTRNCLEDHLTPRAHRRCRSPRMLVRLLRRQAAAPRRCAPVRTVEIRYDKTPAKRTATSAPCSRATRSTRPSASAARWRSARSTSARTCARATSSPCSTTPTTGWPRRPRDSSWSAADAQARQAESDRKRLDALKADGSVSVVRRRESAERRADGAGDRGGARRASSSSRAIASKYTVLRASQQRRGHRGALRGGPGRRRRAAGRLDRRTTASRRSSSTCPRTSWRHSRRRATRRRSRARPTSTFEVVLRELSPQAAAQTRTFRARLKPVDAAAAAARRDRHARRRPPGRRTAPAAAIPAAAITQANGQPAVWVVQSRRQPSRSERVELMRRGGARLSQRRRARVRAAGRRARRHRGRAEDGARA